MRYEEGWMMYIDIKHLKSKGFSSSMISKILGISRPTVIKYVSMTPDEFRLEIERRTQRTKKAEKYDEELCQVYSKEARYSKRMPSKVI